MLSLEHISALLKAHEKLFIAIEDFSNDMLNPNYQRILKEAMKASKDLIEKE